VAPSPVPHDPTRPARWPGIDAARGTAIAAMVAYHFSWDLSYLGLIKTDIVNEPGWQLFARTIAASFLTLVGIGIVLAHQHGGVSWTAFLRRLAIISAAALGVTLVTRFVFPDEYIFFGILHSIAVASILALPFRNAPLAALGAAAFCFMAPYLFTSASLDAPPLDWLGLGTAEPIANDYVPIFPWFGFVLFGIAAGRLLLPVLARASLPPAVSATAPFRALTWAGRRSLLIYLVHQPLLFGALLLLTQVVGPSPDRQPTSFRQSCEASCGARGGEQAYCASACVCAAGKLGAAGVGGGLSDNGAATADEAHVRSLLRPCFAEGAADPLGIHFFAAFRTRALHISA
jgi:uncharacterized membrane protein